jgi:20S proteasome alpha/beta subunit
MASDFNKIYQINDRTFILMSGVASHAQFVSRAGKAYSNGIGIDLLETSRVAVSKIAHALHRLIQGNKEYLLTQMIIGGVDDAGPHVWSLMQSGMKLEREFVTGGSGSLYITAYCDEFYTPGMTVAEATEFALKAITLATIRDGASGAPIQIVQVRADGTDRKFFTPEKLPFDLSIVKT